VGVGRPNILFILIDDMGWMDLSCQGSKFYETPNIDSIAREGLQFTRAYASCPVCSPTRASLLTGKYPARVGITQWIGGENRGKVIGAPYLHNLPLSEYTLPKTLKDNGYNTFHVGKWHLGDNKYSPEKHGFDVNIGGCHMGSPWSGYFSPYNIPTLPDGPEGEYLTDRLTDEAIKLIKNHIKDSNNGNYSPFFLNMSFYSVHTPVQAPNEEIAYFERKLKDMKLDEIDPLIYEDIDFHLENRRLSKIRRRIVQSHTTYAAMIHRLDENIGRLLKTLDDVNIGNDTIVIFFSDNGGLSDSGSAPTSNLPLRNGKSYMYEGGIREPLLIRWKNSIDFGQVTDYPVTTPDFYPTLLEWCNIDLKPQQHIDGKSFAFLKELKNENRNSELQNSELIISKLETDFKRGPIFWHYPHYNNNGACPASAVIDGDWKLIEWHEESELELFNLKKDIGEKVNLAKAHPEKTTELFNILNNWKDEVKAKMPKKNPSYHLFDAKKYIKIQGQLSNSGGGLILLTAITRDKTQCIEISIEEALEELNEKTISLRIGSQVRIGRLEMDIEGGNQSEDHEFYDTHEEKYYSLQTLLSEYNGKNIAIRQWDEFPENLLKEYPQILPQIQIEEVGWDIFSKDG
jgi:arylsulfatase A-like enzyme